MALTPSLDFLGCGLRTFGIEVGNHDVSTRFGHVNGTFFTDTTGRASDQSDFVFKRHVNFLLVNRVARREVVFDRDKGKPLAKQAFGKAKPH